MVQQVKFLSIQFSEKKGSIIWINVSDTVPLVLIGAFGCGHENKLIFDRQHSVLSQAFWRV